MTDLPKNFEQAESEYYKHHDPYDYEGEDDNDECCSCKGIVNIEDLCETPIGDMCNPCIEDGYADEICSRCNGSGEYYIEFGRCSHCNGAGVIKYEKES